MKNNKGITLIALVVTIIVLLILAGVSIAMLTGDNGILKRSQEAAYSNDVGNAKDEIAMKASEAVTNWNAVKYGNLTSVEITDAEKADIDVYIKNQLSKIEATVESNYNVTVTITEPTTEAPNGKIEIVSNKEASFKTSTTWKAGGNFSAWKAE